MMMMKINVIFFPYTYTQIDIHVIGQWLKCEMKGQLLNFMCFFSNILLDFVGKRDVEIRKKYHNKGVLKYVKIIILRGVEIRKKYHFKWCKTTSRNSNSTRSCKKKGY